MLEHLLSIALWWTVGGIIVALLLGYATRHAGGDDPTSVERVEYLHEDRGERSRAAVLARLESIPVPGSWDTGEGA